MTTKEAAVQLDSIYQGLSRRKFWLLISDFAAEQAKAVALAGQDREDWDQLEADIQGLADGLE